MDRDEWTPRGVPRHPSNGKGAGSAAPACVERCSTPQGCNTERGSIAPATPLERRSGAPAEECDDVLDFEPGSRTAPATPTATSGVVAAFLRWFGGRRDVYARQWYDARRDRSGYWPVREPLTERVVEQHLLGRITLGQYVLYPDNTVSFAALDLDPTAEALEQIRLASDGEGALSSTALVDYARRILAAAQGLQLPLFAEETGGAGLHLWLFFAPRLPAERARAVLRELLWRAGAQPPAVAVELFPKQDRLSGKGLGNLIKLPLGVHQATLRPSRLLDHALQPRPPDEALADLQVCDPAILDAVTAKRVVPLPQARAAAAKPVAPLHIPHGPTPRVLAEALAAIPAGREAEAAADRILAGCSIVRELARRAHEESALSADAARALLYSVGLVGRDNERIESIFANAGISRKELDRVRRGLQGPVGCKKLRERFASVGCRCTCPEPPPGGYATPALFAFREPPEPRRPPPPEPATGEIAADPSDASLVEIHQRLAEIEGALAQLRRELVAKLGEEEG